MKEMKIDDVKVEKEKKAKEPAPHVKAAQIEKEAVRALSVDEAEALTKSTYGGVREEDGFSDMQTWESVQKENERLREENFELVNRICGEDQLRKDMEILKTECLDLKEENKKYRREIDDYKKTISKMKYAHQEEIRALEDDLAEAKILCKKAGEYTSMLDADSDTFETILELAKIIHGLAKNAESVSLLIKDEVEGHI